MEKKMSEENETLIREIYADVREIKTKLDRDCAALYGNGHPGLIDRVQKLENEFSKMNEKRKWYREWLGWIFAAIAFFANYVPNIIKAIKQ